ncbi:hypothetical protein [Hoeflea poritis]|uniref:Galactosyltransferase Lgt5 n=1 Tax=Hoeflea poritis TaxID=2993659 RepID=A0ABT4VPY7_9HYPH|nr:hypothetical protein [Hoeflea poritis]MDA4846746.1 hypothetical protein [Hoeflea poritis]
MLPAINALWIGPVLGPVHASCLVSFARAGHRVVLHAFDEIEDVPEGIELFDATRLMARDEIIRHNSGSLALASDIYRYRIQREAMGIYVDCDVYCLKPFPGDDYLFGWEADDLIGTAVQRIPAGSELLSSMMEASENPAFIPPWYSRRKVRKLMLRKLSGKRPNLSDLDWGSIGPDLLTHHLKRLGMEDAAKPADWFYPVSPKHKSLLNEPGLDFSDLSTNRSLAIHLWSSKTLDGGIAEGSVLARMTSMLD